MGLDSAATIGRSGERDALRKAVGDLAAGPVCLELVGEPGIGKTTMLASLRTEAAATGARVLGARGSEFEHDRPFGILVDALDGHLGALDERLSRRVHAAVAVELAGIFPALGSPPAATSMVPAGERFRTHRAVRALLELLAEGEPLVLALDDVHWADSSSVELIGALLRGRPAARVMIALAYRTHQAPERLIRELAVAQHDGVLRRVALGPLSQSEADALMASDASDADREWLFTESGGNPFYLHQLARSPGAAGPRRDLGAGVPPTVAASLFAELDAVSAEARGLAQAISIVGDPFDLDLAGHVALLDRHQTLASLDELVDADLMRADGGPMGLAFRHPLVRRAVYESAAPGWRIAAHARADAAMAARGASATARARHVERSAAIGDMAAVEILVIAAEAAIVPADAARWLQAALRLAADAPQRLSLLCRLGAALAAAGRLDESRDTLIEALAEWPSGSDEEGRIGLVVLCATVERLLGRHEQARVRLAAAAGELDDPESPTGVALSIELAAESAFADDFDAMRAPAVAAMRGAAGLGDPALLAVATAIASFANYCACDLDGAHERAAEAGAIVDSLDDAAIAVRPDAFFFLAFAERLIDRYAAALGHFERGVAVARASGHSQLFVELTAGRANVLAEVGRITEARSAIAEAVEAARLSDHPQPVAWALLMSCVVETAAGDLRAAIRDGREALALAVDDSSVSATIGVVLGVALVEDGQCAEAIELMLEWAGGPELPGIFPMLRPAGYLELTRAEITRGRLQHAAGWADRADAIVDLVRCDLARARAKRARSSLLLARGEYARAAEHALAAVAAASAVDARVEATRARLLAGQALAAAGETGHAAEQLREAEMQAASCGMQRVRQECVRELRRIGLRVARAGLRGDQSADGPAALSGREREVAELVHARHTNREIAALLFLSEKTIESHMRSVFVKLGVSSRADVARALDAP